MKTNYLLPNKYKKLGWFLFLGGIIFYTVLLIIQYDGEFFKIEALSFDYGNYYNDGNLFKIIKNDILDELISLLIIIGGLIVGFSKEKVEDEFIYKLRNDSLVWAIILNYSILLITIPFIYGGEFLGVMIYNMFTPLIFFIIRFNFLKHKARSDEE